MGCNDVLRHNLQVIDKEIVRFPGKKKCIENAVVPCESWMMEFRIAFFSWKMFSIDFWTCRFAWPLVRSC